MNVETINALKILIKNWDQERALLLVKIERLEVLIEQTLDLIKELESPDK